MLTINPEATVDLKPRKLGRYEKALIAMALPADAKCKHCGRGRGEHARLVFWCPAELRRVRGQMFEDSGERVEVRYEVTSPSAESRLPEAKLTAGGAPEKKLWGDVDFS
jgi:hypothetical protein